MTKIPRIELHGEAPDGSVYVLHKLERENVKIQNSGDWALATMVAMLRITAETLASRWRNYLPEDKIRVVGV